MKRTSFNSKIMAKSKAKRGVLDGYTTYDTSKGFGNSSDWQESFRQRMSKEDAKLILQDELPENVLGLQPGVTESEIKKAYRKLMMEWHPDRNQHRLEEAEAMSKKIIAAYTTLVS